VEIAAGDDGDNWRTQWFTVQPTLGPLAVALLVTFLCSDNRQAGVHTCLSCAI